MTDITDRLRGAVAAVMAHQWSHSRKGMQALTDLVDAAAAGADELDRLLAERESMRDVLRACQRHLACNACTSDMVALYERVRAALVE